MLGQVRLGMLAAGWQTQGARVPPELGARWLRYSLIFLVVAGLIAFALPTGYTAGALGWLGSGLLLVLGALWITVALLAAIVMVPLGWLLSLFTHGGTPEQISQPIQLTPPPQIINQPMPPWVEVVRTILVWGLIIGMVLYVVINYLRERPGLLRSLRHVGALRGLRQMWAALRHRLSGLAEAARANPVSAWLRERLQARPGRPPLRYFRLGGASPREQVQYYYLSLLRRAGERGFGRRPAQTPQEYHPTLRANLPENAGDVQALTDAFIETRYSAHPVGPEQAQGVRAAWQRLRAALAQQKKTPPKE
jgi:hypothetical protein